MTVPFLALPIAFAALMAAITRDYLERCKKLGQEPDMVLLTPIIAAFDRLKITQEGSS